MAPRWRPTTGIMSFLRGFFTLFNSPEQYVLERLAKGNLAHPQAIGTKTTVLTAKQSWTRSVWRTESKTLHTQLVKSILKWNTKANTLNKAMRQVLHIPQYPALVILEVQNSFAFTYLMRKNFLNSSWLPQHLNSLFISCFWLHTLALLNWPWTQLPSQLETAITSWL